MNNAILSSISSPRAAVRASLPLRMVLGLSAASLLLVACPSSSKQAPLLTAKSDATSAECAHGGSVVLSGLDKNHDDKLEASEVVARNVLCKDAPGAPPPVKPPPVKPDPEDPVVRVRVTPVPAGKDCEHGGSVVASGLDENANGKLDTDEVEDTQLTCDDSLVSRVSSSAEGDGCVGSGVLYELGRDRNHDQKLGDDEVEWSEQECSDVLAHDVTIQSADELAAIAHIRVIEGDLFVEKSELSELALPELEQIGGRLWVYGNTKLAKISLEKLGLVGHQLELSDNQVLENIELPVLGSVGGSFSITKHPALATFDCKLRRTNGDLTLSENAGLGELSLFLSGSVRNVRIDKNTALTKLTLWSEDDSGHDSSIGDMWLANNPLLQEVSVDASEVGGVHINNDAALESVFLTTQRADSVDVYDVPALTTLVWGTGTEFELEVLHYLSVSAPVNSLQNVNVGTNLTLDGTALTSLSLGIIGGDTRLTNNAKLANLWIHDPRGSIEFTNNDALTSALINPFNPWVLHGSLTVKDNAILPDLAGFRHATQIDGYVSLSGNPKLVNVELYDVLSLAGLNISDNPSLLVLLLGKVSQVGNITIADTALDGRWFDLGSLQHADSLTFTHNRALPLLSLPALVSAYSLNIENNAQLATLDLPALKQADNNITAIKDNALLPACQVDELFSRIAGQKTQQGNLTSATCTP